MKLVERELGLEIELRENTASVIVLEDVVGRLPFVEELYSQVMGKEGNWLLVEDEKNYELGKKVEMILEPFSLELNNKKVKAKLYQDIKEIAQDYCFKQGLELHSRICNYLESLLERIPYPVKYEEEWNILELLKAYGVELVEECDSICEKLFTYIKLVNQVCGISIFITVNLKQYLTENQILELYKLAKYSKIQLVLIEFNMSDKKMECEDVFILDKDRCIITY
ncbi:MAG: type II-A CRISPR-associated protein Csn2 [Lachnospiraceae bacterium]|uniref:type II-A CRISPR-associated protein Csn2 n=1 Tax=Roseburia hominis TaxID=301301 RepID=UPI001F3B9A5D|nr:type II-A CRISPR-associated protein Csn2 [Roseburia hominis]MDD6169368.1 type II-A CRISPR-associated protein Csn2 [Lachnospiraceae bacterium]